MNKTTLLRQQIFGAAAAAGNTDVLAATTLADGETTTVTSGITNPDVARTLRLKGNAATTEGLEVEIRGTDILDKEIAETVTMGNSYSTPTDSTKAFKTVTEVVMPARAASGNTISIGFGPALGLDSYCNEYSFTGFYDASQVYAYTHSTAEVSLNTITPKGALNGSTTHAVNYIPAVFPDYNRIWG